MQDFYTTQLQAGLGMIQETRTLLSLWGPGVDSVLLQRIALESGQFPNVSARRLRNIVAECFVPRYLRGNPPPAARLKVIQDTLSSREFEQLLFLFTCRANVILADFVCEVYWDRYASGRRMIANDEAQDFVARANREGKTQHPWSPTTIRRVAGYLTGCCADFGLLERSRKNVRKILPYRVESRVAIFLAYDLHCSGHGDNSVLSDNEWALFGLDRSDVLNEIRRLALQGWFIVQSAGDVTRIGWRYQRMEDVTNAFTEGKL